MTFILMQQICIQIFWKRKNLFSVFGSDRSMLKQWLRKILSPIFWFLSYLISNWDVDFMNLSIVLEDLILRFVNLSLHVSSVQIPQSIRSDELVSLPTKIHFLLLLKIRQKRFHENPNYFGQPPFQKNTNLTILSFDEFLLASSTSSDSFFSSCFQS